MEKNYVSPSIDRTAFHCPHCGTKTPMKWLNCNANSVDDKVPSLWNTKNVAQMLLEDEMKNDEDRMVKIKENWKRDAIAAESGDFLLYRQRDTIYSQYTLRNIYFSVCQESSCGKAALWVHDKLVIPASYVEDLPNVDMPEPIKVIYNEARAVHSLSPRASAALLRLCCEMLCDFLQAKGTTLNNQIADLVTKGMDERIQKALDIVRFIGNDSVHPGQIDLKDNISISHTLFALVNEITQEMISKPKRLDNLYNAQLPLDVRNAIEKRDSQKT